MKKIILFLSVFLFGCNIPYSLDKFKVVLKISKLQAPYSKYNPLYSIKYGEFKNVSNRFFYLQNNRYMAFYMCQQDKSEHKRSELRFKKDFKVSSKRAKILEAKVKIFPLNQKKEFTFLQIHSDGTLKNRPIINKPLLRIVWRKKYHNIYDHLWAIIRLGDGKYSKINLGKKENKFFNVVIKVKNSKLSVWINSKNKIDNFDVSYWDKYYNYFKAGVYLQGEGCAKVLFDELIVK